MCYFFCWAADRYKSIQSVIPACFGVGKWAIIFGFACSLCGAFGEKKRSNQRLICRVKSNFYCRVGVSKKAKKILKANLYQSGNCWNKAFLNALCSLFNWNICKELSHLKIQNNEFLYNFLKYTFFFWVYKPPLPVFATVSSLVLIAHVW